MPTYPNPAGGTMEAANDADARSKGWTPAMGSFGVNTYPGGSGGGGSSSGGGGGVGGTDLGALQNFFGQTAGFSRDELAEKARQFNETLKQTEAQWIREGLPRLEIDQRLQALREWQAQQDVALQRSKLGLDYLTQAANMGGPADYFQQQEFLRGARGRTDVPGLLTDLQNNRQAPTFTGAGTIAPIPQTAAGLQLQLGGGQTVTVPGGSPSPVGGAPAPAVPAASAAPAYDDSQWRAKFAESQHWYGGANWDQIPDPTPQEQTTQAYYNRLQSMGIKATPDMMYSKFQSFWGRMNSPQAAAAPAATGFRGTGVGGQIDPATSGLMTQRYIPPGQQPATPTAAAPVPAGAPAANTSVGGFNTDATLNAIGSIFQRGPTGLTPGTLERYDPNDIALLSSGAKKLGYDPAAWLRAYQRAGVGQTASAAF